LLLAGNTIIFGKTINMSAKEENRKDGREESEMRDFTAQTSGLTFWDDARDDVYQDYLPESKP
jgi:hypothetical protein